MGYTARNEIRNLVHSLSSALYGLSYTRDAGGSPMRITYSGSQVPSPYAGSSAVYAYDGLSRLTGETYLGTSNTWDYDWVGNRLDSGWVYKQGLLLLQHRNTGRGYI